jgi:rubrerythrin
MTPVAEPRAVSVEEVIAIADALERAAVARYSRLAASLRQVRHDDLAATFESLADEEMSHVEGVQRLMRGMPAPPRPVDLQRWVLPETFGMEEAGPAALLTPYKALSIAVRGEERAFTFWTYVASTAGDDSVRAMAEEMARQELVHAAKLRHARRRAYHAEYPHGRRAPENRSYADATAVKLELDGLQDEARAPLAEIMRRLEQVPDVESARLLRDVIVSLTRAEPTEARVREADLHHRIHWAAAAGSKGLLFEAAGLLERLADRGIGMVNATADAAAAAMVQSWVDRTISMVARLNARLYGLEPGLAEIAADRNADQPAAGS